MPNQSALKMMTIGLSFTLSSSVIAAPCEQATELNYQAYESYRQGFPLSRSKLLLKQALNLCPKHAESYNNLAELFSEEGNNTQAIAHYRQALQINPKLSGAWHGLGETYHKQGRFPLSLEAHLHACQTDPDSKARVITFLKTNRHAVTEDGEIIDRESLLVLYDKQRREAMDRLISACGLKAGPVMQKHIFRNFHFATGKATLQPSSAGQLRQLTEIAAALRNINNRVVHVHGHTDAQPFKGISIAESARRNWQLSQARANTIADALDERGVSITRIKIHAHGYRDPLVPENDPLAWAKNRRVEIEVD